MKVKVTVEVQTTPGGGGSVDNIEVDRVLRAVINGVVFKYQGRIENVLDSYGGEYLHGSTVKSKTLIIVDEEKKVEG